MRKLLFVAWALSLLTGCAHVISQELRDRSDKSASAAALFRDPDAFQGKIVIIGGVVVSTQNTNEGTYIEVLQKPLDYRGRPEATDVSHGRFLILYAGYLDTEIYTMGREVTVAGEVLGKLVRPLGEMDYAYPLLMSKEIRLIEPHSEGFPIFFSIGIFKGF